MEAKGCMKDIEEVYGYHNLLNIDEGNIRIWQGSFFAIVTVVEITVKGQECHGYTLLKLRDLITVTSMVL